MKIAIFGLGYVGLTAAGCLLKQGHHVLGVEPSADKRLLIQSGKSPIFEPGLDELLKRGIDKGRLAVTHELTELNNCDIAIVCVGTPSGADGSHNMFFIAEVSRQIANEVRLRKSEKRMTVVYRSTFKPGTMENLIYPIFQGALPDRMNSVELVYNPEFLRESVAIQDFFKPPKIVVGTVDAKPSENMSELHEGIDAPTFITGYREAEITKFVDNSFHALKVTFANEIGRVCTKLNISSRKVHEIFISDTKLNISPYYLRPGGAFGGSCLPKDVRAMGFLGKEVDASTLLVDSLISSNEAHKKFIYEYVTRDLPANAKVLLVGLAFKADSDDLRESPNVDLAERLLRAGYDLRIYDAALKPAKLMGQNFGYAFAHLPTIGKLLITKVEAEKTQFDLVIKTNVGVTSDLNIESGIRVVSTNTLP